MTIFSPLIFNVRSLQDAINFEIRTQLEALILNMFGEKGQIIFMLS
jgi:hypothetical protein